MPNYVKNKILVKGSNKDKKNFFDYVLNEEGIFDFNKLIPMPIELENTNGNSTSTNQTLIEKYGSDNWYSWRIQNWGTKWNCSEIKLNKNDGFASFDTAWSTPTKIWEHIVQKFPHLEIYLLWADENLGYNAGACKFINGKILTINIKENSDEAVEFASKVWDSNYNEQFQEIEHLPIVFED